MTSTQKKLRRSKFAAGLIAGKTQRQAALDAGVPPAGADVLASRMVREPEVQNALEAALRKQEIHEEYVAQRLKWGADGHDKKASAIEYLDRITDYLGHGRKSDAPANLNILSIITGAGLVDAKGQAIDAEKLVNP